MNEHIQKCSSIKHEKAIAVNYCQECRLYMCEKCLDYHKQFYNHHLIDINKDKEEIFNGICQEEYHLNNLEYYCKNHNQLCCDSCIVNFKKKGKGLHSNCDIYSIEDIKDEMKNKLDDNIKLLENLSNSLEESINELTKIFVNIRENKENLKSKIQKIFTKLRNAINMQEDELILEVDKKYEDIFFKEEIIKKCEKLPKRVVTSLEKSKLINKEDYNNNNKLNRFIYDCINLEKNIQDIKILNENIKKCKLIKPNVKLYLEEEEINNNIKNIKLLGQIYYKNFDFGNNNNELKINKDYIITGENQNIITKKSEDKWIHVQSQNSFEKDKKYIWKIKILKSKYNNFMVGIAPKISSNNDLTKKLNISFINSISSVEKYTIQNPYRANLRDNILGEDFNLSSGATYRISASAKRLCGDIFLQGGIWYTSLTMGLDCDNWFGRFKEERKLNNGYTRYYKDVTVPPGKQKGRIFFQIDQPHEGGPTTWFIADISISRLDNSYKNKDNNNFGYYLFLKNSTLYSDLPYYYRNKKTNLKTIEHEVTIIMDMKKRTLKFLIDNEDKNYNYSLYNNIPI